MSLPNGPYNHSDHEKNILDWWLNNGYYKPEYSSKDDKLMTVEEFENWKLKIENSNNTWTLICPPPNAYGRPHIGNISGYAYMDAMARYQRMLGKKVLVLPGKDHAGLEGEGVFVREVLEKKGLKKFEMEREDFYNQMMNWMNENMQKALKDEQDIGLSADFDRNIFTLDPRIVDQVLDTFVDMYEKGMIYKGVRIVNWDPKARSAVADNQTEYIESKTPFFYFKYSFGEIEARAIELKKEFEGKGIHWKIENSEKDKSYLLGSDSSGTKVLGVGFDKVPVGNEISGTVIGILMRIDGDFHIVVKGNDFDGNINDEILKVSKEIFKENAGSHIITFKDHKEDKYYTNGFIIGTVRPETIFADTAIACDPKDERYKEFVGKKIEVEFLGKKKSINFIADYAVDKEFGTGLLKVTPAHSVEDWEIAQRHKTECLPPIQVIGYDLRLNKLCGEDYTGLNIKEARVKIQEDMKTYGNLVFVDENYENKIKIAERTKAPIEPLLSSQWYLNYDVQTGEGKMSMREAAINMVKGLGIMDKGKPQPSTSNLQPVTIHPKSQEAAFAHWMENLRDWAISRSLWWGYRLPVWYAGEVKEEIDDNGQVVELIKLSVISNRSSENREPKTENSEWVQLEYGNPKHIRVQKYNPDSVVIDVIRHGKSVDNVNKIVSGLSDCDLAPEGIQQAQEFNPTANYDLIITSTLKRAQQTAQIIAQKLNITDIIESELLVEKDYGEVTGLTYDEVMAKYPGYTTPFEILDLPDLTNGESSIKLEERVDKFINNLKANYPGKRILVVTHGGLMMILAKKLLNLDSEHQKHFDPKNLQVVTMEIAPLEISSWHQDESVLDTWFSSGQWVHSTLKAFDLYETFYPSQVMVSGFDILQNWISRMMMFSYFSTGESPFKDVYLTGLVQGTDGQKMSKSHGNIISIDDVRQKYGTDAVRMSFFYQNSAGANYPITMEKLTMFKSFNNKIWNASKFILMNVEGNGKWEMGNEKLEFSKKALEHIREIKERVTRNIENFDFGLATFNLYNEFWHTYCDILIEESKPHILPKLDKETKAVISQPTQEEKDEASEVMLYVLKEYLKMLHPFIPFITQTIWDEVPKNEGEHKVLMYTRW